jgi:hypothetical protein
MSAAFRVRVRAHWVNAWFLCLFARPRLLVDGEESELSWREALRVEASPGDHEVGVGVRYFGRGQLRGCARTRVTAPEGGEVALIARNGLFNHEPFRVVAVRGDL